MKLQDVLLKAMAKKITWWDAAEIIGVTDRTMRRWRLRLDEEGYSGLVDRRKGKVSDRRVPVAVVEEVLRLYKETYFDLNIRHFHEKLGEEHDIQLSYTWVQKALQGAGLVARGRKRRKHRRRRERRPLVGMLLHIDGSKHQWFGDERWYDLIVILDDASSEIYYAQLVEEESTRTVMAGLRAVVESKGLFCALYSDRGSHFFVTPKAGEKVDKQRLTQVGRAMKELGVQMIPAYSPQARGRSERSFGDMAGAIAAGNPAGRNRHRGGGQSVFERALYRDLQREVRGCPGAEGDGVSAGDAFGSGLGVHDTDGACGGQGQHSGHRRPDLATGEESLPQLTGRMHGNHSRTPGRGGVDPLWSTCGRPLSPHRGPLSDFVGTKSKRPWKSRARGSRGKPKGGFPPLPPPLGNPSEPGFPLSHRPDDGFTITQKPNQAKTQTPFGKPKRDCTPNHLNRTDHV